MEDDRPTTRTLNALLVAVRTTFVFLTIALVVGAFLTPTAMRQYSDGVSVIAVGNLLDGLTFQGGYIRQDGSGGISLWLRIATLVVVVVPLALLYLADRRAQENYRATALRRISIGLVTLDTLALIIYFWAIRGFNEDSGSFAWGPGLPFLICALILSGISAVTLPASVGEE